jgi:3D (Asp-Asp-Asp) domain-containing protein
MSVPPVTKIGGTLVEQCHPMPRAAIVCAVLCASLLAASPLLGRPSKPSGQARARQFTASAYCLAGKTASGTRTRLGIVAADYRILPLGSIIHIDTPAQPYSGTYKVTDGGAAVKGRRIDLFIPDCNRAKRFGKRQVSVRLLRHGAAP